MPDNLTVQGFNSFFTYTMCEVLQDVYDPYSTSLFLFLVLSLVLNIFFLKIWFDNRAKKEAYLEMVHSLQTESRLLRKEVLLQLSVFHGCYSFPQGCLSVPSWLLQYSS